MSNYLYNGVELPALPEWDKEAYPYAAIYTNADRTIFKFCYDAAGEIVNSRGTCLLMGNGRIMNAENGAWVTAEGGLNYTPIWANYDVFYSTSAGELSGQLFLAASEPVPVSIVSSIDTISMTLGWLVGRRIASQRRKKEPVAHLYNGIEFPAIPAYDKTAYPYAHILQDQHADDTYIVVVTDREMEYDHTVGYLGYYIDAISNETYTNFREATMRSNGVNAAPAEWGVISTSGTVDGFTSGGIGGILIWSNYKLTSTAGLSTPDASDPVPVYK